jgi:hypothetical protein
MNGRESYIHSTQYSSTIRSILIDTVQESAKNQLPGVGTSSNPLDSYIATVYVRLTHCYKFYAYIRLTTMNDLSYVTKINIGNCIDQDNGVRGAPG